jgi:hypothetical protein
MGVEEKLEERDLKREKVEATEGDQIKEKEREGTDAEAIKDLQGSDTERKQQERETTSEQVDVAVYGMLKLDEEPQGGMRAAREVEATLHRQVEELRISLT